MEWGALGTSEDPCASQSMWPGQNHENLLSSIQGTWAQTPALVCRALGPESESLSSQNLSLQI